MTGKPFFCAMNKVGGLKRGGVEKTAFERAQHFLRRQRQDIKFLRRHAEFFQSNNERHVIGGAQATGDADFFPFQILQGFKLGMGHKGVGDLVGRNPNGAKRHSAQARAYHAGTNAGEIIDLAGNHRRHGNRRGHENDFGIQAAILKQFPLPRGEQGERSDAHGRVGEANFRWKILGDRGPGNPLDEQGGDQNNAQPVTYICSSIHWYSVSVGPFAVARYVRLVVYPEPVIPACFKRESRRIRTGPLIKAFGGDAF